MFRKIIHIDMDAFFAAVEQRDRPELRGKPVVVGGDPSKRGVVSTCSYEARHYGIHSAMPVKRAYRLCPHAVFVRPRFDAYKDASIAVFKIFHEYTNLVESMSLDEAYLDVTQNRYGIKSASLVASEIQKKIYEETALTASAGVSYNMFLAKAASDFKKPCGLTIVPPERAIPFIDDLPIGRFHGIGKVTEEKMKNLNIYNGKDLRQRDREFLIKHFGKTGSYFYDIVRGVDNREVNPVHIRKSIGKEVTLEHDIDDIQSMHEILLELTGRVCDYLDKTSRKGRTVTLKIKYDNFESVTRSVTVNCPVCRRDDIFPKIQKLLMETEAGIRRVRLLGVSVSNFEHSAEDISGGQLVFPF